MRLLAMPAAQHLFRAVLAISPGDPSVSLARATRAAGRVASAVGAAARLESIADVDPLAIYDARDSFNPRPTDLLNRLAIRGFRPMLPGPVIDHTLVPDTVDAALVAGVGSDKTLYIGATAHEFNESKLPFAPLLRNIPARVALERAGLPEQLAAKYADDADDDTTWAVGQVATDVTFRCHVARWSLLRAGATAPTWVYDFRWESGSPTVHGAAHCVDVPFGFDILGAPGVEAALGDSPPQGLADAVHADWLGVITGAAAKRRRSSRSLLHDRLRDPRPP